MKKIMILLVILLFLLVGCSKETDGDQTNFDILNKRVKDAYPNGFERKDGWYELDMSKTIINANGQKEIISLKFIGEMDFIDNYGNGCFKNLSAVSCNMLFESEFTANPYKTEKQEYVLNDNIYYQKTSIYENGDVTTSIAYNDNPMEDIKINFNFEFNYVISLFLIKKASEETLRESEMAVTGNWLKYYAVPDENTFVIKTYEKEGNSKYSASTDKFFFNDKGELIEEYITKEGINSANSKGLDYCNYIFKRIDPVEIKVPTDYTTKVEGYIEINLSW